jgi:2-polyprenyl-6-methoxyphenol hydroxylase-like FAD-dependent oxidoreductase
MRSVRNVLIVGSGAAGCAAAILFARDGAAVELVEIKPDLSALGSGITVQGNALRVLRQLGVWNEVAAAGYAFNTVGLRTPDGTLLVEMEDVRTGGPDLPATVGMYRPALARILTEAAAAAGAKLRYGTTAESLTHDADGVDVTFSDGTSSRYDLVIGADGVRSQIRSLLGIKLESKPTGMGIWRVFTSRPESVTRTDLYYRGACYIAGYCPTADDSLYAYLVEGAQDRAHLTPGQRLEIMRDLASHYHGPWDDIRAVMTDPGTINYTWFESHLLPPPWNRGRVVLIGHGPGGRRRAGRRATRGRRSGPGRLRRVHRPPLRPRQDRRGGVGPARPVDARRRRGKCARPDGQGHEPGQPARLRTENHDKAPDYPPAARRPGRA